MLAGVRAKAEPCAESANDNPLLFRLKRCSCSSHELRFVSHHTCKVSVRSVVRRTTISLKFGSLGSSQWKRRKHIAADRGNPRLQTTTAAQADSALGACGTLYARRNGKNSAATRGIRGLQNEQVCLNNNGDVSVCSLSLACIAQGRGALPHAGSLSWISLFRLT